MRAAMRSSSEIRTGSRGRWRRALSGLAAVALLGGGLLGLTTTTASASTSAFTLSMTSGTFASHGNAAHALPTPATFSGHVNSTTGHITGGTLTVPSWAESNTGSTETIHIYDVHAGTDTGTVSYQGNVTLDVKATIQVHITSPLSFTCKSTPVDLTLQSTSPYNKTTKNVDLSDTTFTIPNFTSTSCGLARSTLDSRFAGSSGNLLSLDLHGTLPEPPAPTTSTTTSLSASPASPQRQGTTVTFTATVKKTTGATATGATGTMNFYGKDGSTATAPLAAEPVTSGVATYPTTTLKPGTESIKAVYSGNSAYNGSTSSALAYVIEPNPTVTVTPSTFSVTKGSTHTFTVKVTDPSSGQNWSSLWVHLRFNNVPAQESKMSLAYKNATATWCPITLSGAEKVTGVFKGLTGACSSASSFSLTHGHSLTVPLRVSYTSAANVGLQKFTATLETISSGAPVAPFTGATSATVPTTSPYAQAAVHINPVTKYTVKLTTGTVPASTHKGYVLAPNIKIKRPTTSTITTTTNTIVAPVPTGTVTYLVDGHTFTPKQTSGASPSNLELAFLPTSGLSVGSHTLKVEYSGDGVYKAISATVSFTISTPASGTAFVCSNAVFHNITASVVVTGTLPSTSYTGKASATTLDVTLHTDPTLGTTTTGITLKTVSILLSPGGATTAPAVKPTISSGIATASWTGLTAATIPVTGANTTEVSVGIKTVNFAYNGVNYTCGANPTAAHIGTVKVVAPPTPVTWSVSGCTTGSTTAPAWANTEKVVAKGAGGGGGGAAASATGYGGAGGAGGSVTTTFTISGSSTVAAKTGCAGKGAPQGSGVVGNGGASVSGWSASGKGGQGRYTAIGITHGNDGTGGGGGGSTGVCNGASTCTSATTAHVVAVASGGGGGGESMCSGTDAGNGGQAGNAGTTATSSSKGKGLSGTGGATGGTGGVAGGAGGANNKSSGSGSATGSAGGQGKEPVAGDGGGSGGGGAGYIGGAGGAPTADDCGAGGGGGGGSSWVATAGGSTTFGTGASGGSRSGTTGTAGSVTVTFSYTRTR